MMGSWVSLVSLAAVFSIVTQRSYCVTILKTAARANEGNEGNVILWCSVPTLSVPLHLLAGNGASCQPSTNYGYMRLYFS